MKISDFLLVLVLIFIPLLGCSKSPTEANTDTTPVALMARFLKNDVVMTTNGAYRDEFTLLLPGLKTVGPVKDHFITITQNGDTLIIKRDYYPVEAQSIRLFFDKTPADTLGFLTISKDSVYISPDKISGKPTETPGLSGNGGLRFDYDFIFIVRDKDLRNIDTLRIYDQENLVWHLAYKLSRAEIMLARQYYKQGLGDPSEPNINDPFIVQSGGKSIKINIRPLEIKAEPL